MHQLKETRQLKYDRLSMRLMTLNLKFKKRECLDFCFSHTRESSITASVRRLPIFAYFHFRYLLPNKFYFIENLNNLQISNLFLKLLAISH